MEFPSGLNVTITSPLIFSYASMYARRSPRCVCRWTSQPCSSAYSTDPSVEPPSIMRIWSTHSRRMRGRMWRSPAISLSTGITRVTVTRAGPSRPEDIVTPRHPVPVRPIPVHHLRDADLEGNRGPEPDPFRAREVHDSSPVAAGSRDVPHDVRLFVEVADDDLHEAPDRNADAASEIDRVTGHVLCGQQHAPGDVESVDEVPFCRAVAPDAQRILPVDRAADEAGNDHCVF